MIAKYHSKRILTDEEKALTLRMVEEGCRRDDLATALCFPGNYLPELMRANGLGEAYTAGMARARSAAGAQSEGYATDISDEANRRASETLAQSLIKNGALPDPSCRPERTFEEKLRLVAAGKARIVPNVRICRPVAVTSAYGEAMS